jgi:mono/diheme cytochrome c family protein
LEQRPEATGVTGKQLFGNYCAPCHGEKGDGNGPAARFLYPKPRNFGEAKFRLASTLNGIPSDDDLMRVITRGMPGSAMFPFSHLAEDERRALVAQVRSLIHSATTDRVKTESAERGEPLEGAELVETVNDLTKQGQPFEIPSSLPASSPASVARGQTLYAATCANCHGEKGKGDGGQDQRDANGMPTRPRDFTRGIFKGGREPERLYARIRFGMPGTPMPASLQYTPEQMGDMVNFILSLSDPSAQGRVEHKRQRLVAKKSVKPLGGNGSDEDWRTAEAVPVVVSPLWWRNYDEPELRVAALHDGETLAIRFTWRDATRDDSPVRPQEFDDMASLQLFKGKPEPFLGMGDANGPLDVWLWRARWLTDADVDSVYPNMAVDIYPLEKTAAGARPHAAANQPPEFLTARAAGNLTADTAGDIRGSDLQAKGFGTLTMRPRVSQDVRSSGSWKDGSWTVVFRRPLQVKDNGGISLSPGDKLSIAFAIWDGSAGDRNGQKLVSIWHDLELE